MRLHRAYRRWLRRLDSPVAKAIGILLLAAIVGLLAWIIV